MGGLDCFTKPLINVSRESVVQSRADGVTGSPPLPNEWKDLVNSQWLCQCWGRVCSQYFYKETIFFPYQLQCYPCLWIRGAIILISIFWFGSTSLSLQTGISEKPCSPILVCYLNLGFFGTPNSPPPDPIDPNRKKLCVGGGRRQPDPRAGLASSAAVYIALQKKLAPRSALLQLANCFLWHNSFWG